MAMRCFEAIIGDVGLFASVLVGDELFDWCALQATAPWASLAVRRAHAVLRDHVRKNTRCSGSVWDCVGRGDVTALWAFGKDSSMMQHDGKLLGDGNQNTLLHWAMFRHGPGYLRLVRWLLMQPGASEAVRSKNVRGQAVLHLCALVGSSKAAAAVMRLPGVDVDARDSYEATPLVLAVREEHPGVVQTLLAGRCDPNTFVPNCHGHGDTPLVLAVRLKNTQIVKQLVAVQGIDFHKKTLLGVPFGKEAIDFAPQQGEIRRVLEEAIARASERIGPAGASVQNETPVQRGGPFAESGGAVVDVEVWAAPAVSVQADVRAVMAVKKPGLISSLLWGCGWCA